MKRQRAGTRRDRAEAVFTPRRLARRRASHFALAEVINQLDEFHHILGDFVRFK
jgi:hypothetical protein